MMYSLEFSEEVKSYYGRNEVKAMNKNLRHLVGVGALNVIADLYMGIFVTSQIYTLAQNSTTTVAMFYIVEYVFLATTFLLFGTAFKRKPVQALRFGIVLNLALLVMIIATGDNIIQYYGAIAVLFGVSQGAYYSPFNVLVGVYNDQPVRYCTLSSIVFNIVNIVFPITIGAYITVTSFTAVTMCMIVVSALEIVISFGIDKVETEAKCDLRVFLNFLSTSSSKKRVVNYYKIGFLKGITSSVLDRTVLILIMMMYGSSFELGMLNTIFAIFSILATWLVKKFYSNKNSNKAILVSGMMPMIAVVMLVVATNSATFITYKAISSIFICVLSILADIIRFGCMDKEANEKFAAEHQAMCETALAGGRISGLIILVAVNGLIGGMLAIKVMLVIISFAIVLMAYYIRRGRK